jgi:[protein-PII] uridylyltransferase
MDPQAFFVAKTLEMQQRHNKFEDTPYALEPNCKESPGGLRDLQVMLWVAKAAGLGKNWDELARKRPGHAVRGQADQTQRGLLRLIRARLHLLATGARTGWCLTCKRRGGVLWLPLGQSPMAAVRTCQRGADAALLLGGQGVTQLNQILLLNIEERLNPSTRPSHLPINARFQRQGRHDRRGQRRPVPAPAACHPGDLSALPDHGRHQGPVGAHLRALYNARQPDGRQVPQRPGQPRNLQARSSCSTMASPMPCA